MGINFTEKGMDSKDQAPVVQIAGNFMHGIGRYPADKLCARFSR